MHMVWLIFLVELFAAFVIRSFAPDEVVVILLIGVNIPVMLTFIVTLPRRRIWPFLAGYVMRCAVAAFDSATHILANWNPDTLGYYASAVSLATGGSNTYGGMYSRLLSYVFQFSVISRGLAEYINVLLGMTTIWIVHRMLCRLEISERYKSLLVWAIAVFPYSVYGSCIPYRETAIAVLTAASAYYALCWYQKRSWQTIVKCIACLLFGATFHAGVVIMGVGYILLFALYSHRGDRYVINRRTVPLLIVCALGLLVLIFFFRQVFFAKLMGMSEEVIVFQANRSSGGSAYLKWINPRSLVQVLLCSPLKLVYFLFSPMPWDWRGLKDIGAFLVDSLVYVVCLCYVFKNYKYSENRKLVLALLLGFFATAFVFGVGTWNAGTAIRHRNKIFSVLLLMTALSMPRPGSRKSRRLWR